MNAIGKEVSEEQRDPIPTTTSSVLFLTIHNFCSTNWSFLVFLELIETTKFIKLQFDNLLKMLKLVCYQILKIAYNSKRFTSGN